MSFEIRCNCGWSSQVSEFYLGDCITCPECSAKVEVRENAGVPYAYPPYPTWQKQIPAVWTARYPRPRRHVYQPSSDPHASPAFWMGLGSLFFSLIGCGILPGILMAIFALRSASDSRSFCRRHNLQRPLRAPLGSMLGVASIVIALGMVLGLATGDHGRTGCHKPRQVENHAPGWDRDRPVDDSHAESALEAERRRSEQRRSEQWQQWQQELAEKHNYRYPVRPEPTPVQPGNDFERKQVEYSQRVREQRAAGTPEPNSYRYGE